MRNPWFRFIPLLVFGFVAAACLVLMPFRPARDQLLILLVGVVSLGTAIGMELRQAERERAQGRLERRLIRHHGAQVMAFVIPMSARYLVGMLLAGLLVSGLGAALLLLTYTAPVPGLNPGKVRAVAAVCIALGILTLVLFPILYWRGAHQLALLPDGFLVANYTLRCFVPWTHLAEVCPARLAWRAICVGFRVTDLQAVETAPATRRLMQHWGTDLHWHFFCQTTGLTLSAPRAAWLLWAYLQQPGEQPKIGTEAELATVKAALAEIGDQRLGGWLIGLGQTPPPVPHRAEQVHDQTTPEDSQPQA